MTPSLMLKVLTVRMSKLSPPNPQQASSSLSFSGINVGSKCNQTRPRNKINSGWVGREEAVEMAQPLRALAAPVQFPAPTW